MLQEKGGEKTETVEGKLPRRGVVIAVATNEINFHDFSSRCGCRMAVNINRFSPSEFPVVGPALATIENLRQFRRASMHPRETSNGRVANARIVWKNGGEEGREGEKERGEKYRSDVSCSLPLNSA